MNKLLAVLAGILYLMQRHYTAKEISDAQKSANAVSDKPTDWFKSHFVGVSGTNTDTKAAANKADTDEHL